MEIKRDKVSCNTVMLFSRLAGQLRPKDALSLSAWADKYMVLPEGSSESGRYSSSTIPYQKDIMDAITDPEVTDVAVMSSSQVGKTTIIMVGIAYYIDYEPSTQMVVMPTIHDGEKFSKTRLAQMISDIPNLREKVSPAKSRDANNTILLKVYPGGSLSIGGANSPSSLASDPRRIIWMDEVDRYPESAGTEGNPILLAEKRATSYWNKKHILTSTPTNAKTSKIKAAYDKGSQEEWQVACPACGEYQAYEFERIDFESVGMVCAHCGVLSSEREWKDSEHKWVAHHPERKKFRSFKLNELASPFVDWDEIIDAFKDANDRYKRLHDPHDLKVFKNTRLGEVWDDEALGETLDDEVLYRRAEAYDGELPDGVILLTGAVDVQDNRLEVEIKGWGRDFESWGIYKTEIYGELIRHEIWDELEAYLGRTFTFADGRELNVAAFAIDSGGHHTNDVYRWAREMRRKGKNCYAIKGYAGKDDIELLHRKTTVEIKEKRSDGKEYVIDQTVLHVLGVDAGKEDITQRLKIDEPGEGYCHFPVEDGLGRGYDEDYFRGLTSEYKIDKMVGGKYKKVWVKKSGVRNEPLDLFNYNYAALMILKPDFDILEDRLKKGINYMKMTRKKPQNMAPVNGMR